MYQIEVEILQPQIRKRLFAAPDGVSLRVHIIPDLRGDEKLLAPDKPGRKHLAQRLSDLLLVSINAGAVDQPIACRDPALDGLRDLLRAETVVSECAHADARHMLTGIERFEWDARRVNAVSLRGLLLFFLHHGHFSFHFQK